MEDINRHYCVDIDICQRGNVGDKVAMEEEEEGKVRTLESPRRTAQYTHTDEKKKHPGEEKAAQYCFLNLHFIRLPEYSPINFGGFVQ